MDVLSASSSDKKIAWYENDGAPVPSFVEHIVSTSAFWARSVFAIDLDDDSDTDILSASEGDDKLAWYENDGGRHPSFSEHVITQDPDGLFGPLEGIADWAGQVTAGDLDGDGDIDVLGAAPYAEHFYWYENDGGSPPHFTPRIVEQSTFLQIHVHLIDMDKDGDLDIVSNSGDSINLAWFENDGLSPPAFEIHPIWPGEWAPSSFYPTDLDSDGDVDVLVPDALGERTIWFESDGGTPPTFTMRTLSDHDAYRIFAADLDGDGDIDPVATLSAEIVWYENRLLRPHGTSGKRLPNPRDP